MNRPPAAPMPLEVRNLMRARQHPARAVACPHCGAHDRGPCRTVSGRRLLTEPHPARISAWAEAAACCPQCQVTPGVPCHEDGRARTTVHDRRYQEAEEAAA